jgi:hypothetical protein
MELAALTHSSARARNLLPVIMDSIEQKRGQPVAASHAQINRPKVGRTTRIDQLGWVDTVELVPSEALKSETIGSRVGVAGEQPYRAGQKRAALHAGVGDIFKIVQPGTAIQLRGCDGRDGRDHHPVSAMWAGEKEARQARCRNTQVSHGTPPIRTYPTTCAYFPPLS